MTSQLTSRNSLQRIPTFALNVRKVLSGGTDGDFYTVPAGKRAVIKGTAVCTGLGAAATVDLDFNGLSFHTWDVAGSTEPAQKTTIIQTVIPFIVELEAGQILSYDQNSGTNAEMNINARIQETPL